VAATIPPPKGSLAEAIAARLELYVGPHTSRVAVKTFSQKALGRGPETITRRDLPALAEALRPMRRTLVGRAASEDAIAAILEEGMR
jgi:transposase